MSTSLAQVAPTATGAPANSPSFIGMTQGELFKIARQRFNILPLLALAGVIGVYYLFLLGNPDVKSALATAPEEQLLHLMARELAITRSFIGIFLLIATARMIGLEYQLGTLRVLLARGTGRMQLLLAKLLTMAIVALVVFVGALVWNVLLASVTLLIMRGNLDAYKSLTSLFWNDTWLYCLTVLVSMGVTILLAAFVTVLGRSLAFGLGVALSWFAVDNIGVTIMRLVERFTHNDFWLKITAYFLGPNLNILPQLLVPARNGGVRVETIGTDPAVIYDTTHSLMVALIYGLVFLVVALVLIWRRDVVE